MSKKNRARLYRRIAFITQDAGLSKEDRLTFAKEMFDGIEDIESYSELSEETLEDLLFIFESWRMIQRLRYSSGHMLTEAQVLIERSKETAEEAAERQTRDDSWD